jgi:hypothetical protein
MLAIDSIMRIGSRNGEEMTVDDMAAVREILESSAAIERFDRRRRPAAGKITYSSVDMLTTVLYIELKKTTLGGAVADLSDAGGQERLKALGMPRTDGRYRCPAKSTISDFINRIWPKLEPSLSEEMREVILGQPEEMFLTGDSTPLEASRYSERCAFNPHYQIRMDKCHIISANGIPLMYTHTGGNSGDCPELMKMLASMDGIDPKRVSGFAADGAYHSYAAYAEVFRKTGKVMAANQGKDAVFHKGVSWKSMLDRYSGHWREQGFVPAGHTVPERILRHLISHGDKHAAGVFLHNLDFRRGKRMKDALAKARHVCETMHFSMKRWMRFDVRGLRKEGVRQRISVRFFFAQILSIVTRN